MITFVDEYRQSDQCLEISEKIKHISTKKINIMEVCGGHTMAIRKNGIHKLVGDNISLISGPGCPVCVTSMADIDMAIALSKVTDTIICTFGDLFYVPGSVSSLSKAKAEGADVRVVYSVYDALTYAKKEKDKKVVFISIGFETTAPTAAAAVKQADEEGMNNFFILGLNKNMPYALRAILELKDSTINALLAPGHVSAITGTSMYHFVADEIGIPCCVSGFEPLDMLTSIYIITELCENNTPKVVNAYSRVVTDEGNVKAKSIMYEVFEESDAAWRGLGSIPSSGLSLNKAFRRFDAREEFNLPVIESKEEQGCICGEILIGKKTPPQCSLYGKVCTPSTPKGACMVSSEGSCAAWYRY